MYHEMTVVMKNIILVVLLLSSYSSFGQSQTEANNALRNITSLDQVDSLKQAHPDWYITITKTLPVGFSYDSVLYNTFVGEVIQTQYSESAPKFYRKVIEKGEEEACKVNYIYLNGKKHNKKEIEEIRKQIIDQYNSGTSFIELVKEYNEDGNPTGELDWFYKGMMDDDFDEAVRKRNANEIFIVDVTKNYWFYVVLKTEGNKMFECSYSIGIKIGT